MALSEQEREWLERRKILCTHCDLISREICKGEKNKTSCQLWEDYHCNNPVMGYKAFQDMQDAAEFEARVAANLAIDRANGKHLRLKGCSWYKITKNRHLVRKTACPPHHDIDNCPGLAMCSIYHARLAAEAEMDRKS